MQQTHYLYATAVIARKFTPPTDNMNNIATVLRGVARREFDIVAAWSVCGSVAVRPDQFAGRATRGQRSSLGITGRGWTGRRQHNEEVPTELGYSAAEIAGMQSAKVV